jgi:hypothetical protein
MADVELGMLVAVQGLGDIGHGLCSAKLIRTLGP